MSQVAEIAAKQLAIRFSEHVRYTLTKEQLAEVVRRNHETGLSSGICHTHDFVDANEVMAAAMASIYGQQVVDGPLLDGTHRDNQRLVDVWNRAWDLAKASDFTL